MVKELIHDPIMLKVKVRDASAEDLQAAADLAETLEYHRNGCVVRLQHISDKNELSRASASSAKLA